MSKVLFVSGFNTHPEEHDNMNLYSSIEVYFKFSNTEVTFFRYKTTEDLRVVYLRLEKILNTKEHDMIITHSMGSCLAMKYIAETNDTRKIIMCMPFITTSRIMRLATYIPLIQYIYVPKCCMIPNHTLYAGGNILNDEVTPVCCNQIYFAITDFFLDEDELIKVIKNHKNLRIIYADNEKVSPIDSSTITQIIEKVTFTKGKHCSFANIIQMSDFFEVLTSQFKKLE